MKKASKIFLKLSVPIGLFCGLITEIALFDDFNNLRAAVLMSLFVIGFMQLALIFYVWSNKNDIDRKTLLINLCVQLVIWILLMVSFFLFIQ